MKQEQQPCQQQLQHYLTPHVLIIHVWTCEWSLHHCFLFSWASVPVLGELPVDRRQAGALCLPRTSIHGHRHPQRASSLLHVPPAPVKLQSKLSVSEPLKWRTAHHVWVFTQHALWHGMNLFCFCASVSFTFPSLHPDWMLLLSFAHTHVTITMTLALLFIPKVLISFMSWCQGKLMLL